MTQSLRLLGCKHTKYLNTEIKGGLESGITVHINFKGSQKEKRGIT